MQNYGLANNLWSVIAALVAFATPYAFFVFQEYGRSIPIEVDESARIDGASPIQIYLRIYLPLMAPALVAVGTYAMLLAWNEYLYQFLLLSSKSSMDHGAIVEEGRPSRIFENPAHADAEYTHDGRRRAVQTLPYL